MDVSAAKLWAFFVALKVAWSPLPDFTPGQHKNVLQDAVGFQKEFLNTNGSSGDSSYEDFSPKSPVAIETVNDVNPASQVCEGMNLSRTEEGDQSFEGETVVAEEPPALQHSPSLHSRGEGQDF